MAVAVISQADDQTQGHTAAQVPSPWAGSVGLHLSLCVAMVCQPHSPFAGIPFSFNEVDKLPALYSNFCCSILHFFCNLL